MELILVAIIVGLNVFASIYCFTRKYSERSQKVAQIVIIWLIPLLAAIGFIVFHLLESHPQENPKEFGGGKQDGIDTWGGHRSVDD